MIERSEILRDVLTLPPAETCPDCDDPSPGGETCPACREWDGDRGDQRGGRKITLPYPPSANINWRAAGGRIIKNPEVRAYQTEVGWLAKAAGVRLLDGDVSLTLRIYRPRKAGDLSNRIKVLEDALNGIAWHDDVQVVEIHAYRYDDKDNPRVEVSIKEVLP